MKLLEVYKCIVLTVIAVALTYLAYREHSKPRDKHGMPMARVTGIVMLDPTVPVEVVTGQSALEVTSGSMPLEVSADELPVYVQNWP